MLGLKLNHVSKGATGVNGLHFESCEIHGTSFLTEASFGLRVLSLPVCVRAPIYGFLCVSVFVGVSTPSLPAS